MCGPVAHVIGSRAIRLAHSSIPLSLTPSYPRKEIGPLHAVVVNSYPSYLSTSAGPLRLRFVRVTVFRSPLGIEEEELAQVLGVRRTRAAKRKERHSHVIRS